MSAFIDLTTASAMTSRHRAYRETVLDTSYKNQDTLPKCETIERSYIDTVLAQSGCTGIRIYYGMDSNYCVHAVVVGVNSSDEDILAAGDAVKIIEDSRRCPADCPPTSALNS